ncbi:MAG TPA: AAA family ATPase, partial [Candidatus Obscuribacterales bacterium]
MSPEERLKLFNTLSQLPSVEFGKLIFVLKPPSGVMYGEHAPMGDRVKALLDWVEGPMGRGLAEVQDLLERLDSLPLPGEVKHELGPNPYQGLLAFSETDVERYFGRSEEIETLWSRFRALHEGEGKTRLLPIYGPSGSGKSSLARAGLLAALKTRPLPGRDRAHLVSLMPGTQPLQALAIALARLADNDPTPVKKTREFAEELSVPNPSGTFDGLQRVASALPDIATAPLILLVDQFEEVYSLCDSPPERDQFIANLLFAASDRGGYVSVIITCRSDFLGHTQQHPTLNKLFSAQGFLVPIMQPEALAAAIA